MPNQPDNKTKELTQTIANASIIIRNTENKGRIVISVLSGHTKSLKIGMYYQNEKH